MFSLEALKQRDQRSQLEEHLYRARVYHREGVQAMHCVGTSCSAMRDPYAQGQDTHTRRQADLSRNKSAPCRYPRQEESCDPEAQDGQEADAREQRQAEEVDSYAGRVELDDI